MNVSANWWEGPADDFAPPPMELAPPVAPRRPAPPFLDPRAASARVELCARRALDRPADARRALEWYGAARIFCVGIGRPHGLTLEAVAGAIAALSPQVSWREQTAYAPAILDAWAQDAPIPGPGYTANKVKAVRILDGAPPLDVLGGPKVRAFYRCILTGGADPSAVCVDRHAWAIAHGIERTGSRGGAHAPELTAKRYREAAAAYVDAAARLRDAYPALAPILTPARVQSLTWTHWRERPEDRF